LSLGDQRKVGLEAGFGKSDWMHYKKMCACYKPNSVFVFLRPGRQKATSSASNKFRSEVEINKYLIKCVECQRRGAKYFSVKNLKNSLHFLSTYALPKHHSAQCDQISSSFTSIQPANTLTKHLLFLYYKLLHWALGSQTWLLSPYESHCLLVKVDIDIEKTYILQNLRILTGFWLEGAGGRAEAKYAALGWGSW
jgi:hypothetical protein